MDWTEFNLHDFFALVGFVVAAVEFALLYVQKKHHRASQYIINSIANLAMSKGNTWNGQLNAELVEYKEGGAYTDIQKLLARGASEFHEIFQTATTLEGGIDPASSARLDTTKRNLEQQKLWSQITGKENPIKVTKESGENSSNSN